MKSILQRIGNGFKNFGKGTFYFLTSAVFLKNITGIILLLGLLLFLTSTWMHCYTNHGESLQVHDYVGMQLEDVIEKAEDRSFEIIITDSIFLVGKAPHTVLEQSPKALSRVKKNRKIYLTITKATPDKVLLPDLAGGNDDFNQYSKKLKRLSIDSKIVGRRFSNKLEENTILEVIFKGDTITQQLLDGVKVPMGELVEFIVTEKRGGSVPIPNLICRKYDAVRFLVGNYNLNIGSIINDATVVNENSAYVWKQVPSYSPYGQIRIGDQVDIYLTQYKPDNCSGSAPDPDFEPESNDINIEMPVDGVPETPGGPEENEEF